MYPCNACDACDAGRCGCLRRCCGWHGGGCGKTRGRGSAPDPDALRLLIEVGVHEKIRSIGRVVRVITERRRRLSCPTLDCRLPTWLACVLASLRSPQDERRRFEVSVSPSLPTPLVADTSLSCVPQSHLSPCPTGYPDSWIVTWDRKLSGQGTSGH